jgi:hypothetical protein
MKNREHLFIILIHLILFQVNISTAKPGQNEFEKTRASAILQQTETKQLINDLKDDPDKVITYLQKNLIISGNFSNYPADFSICANSIAGTGTTNNIFNSIDLGENVAIILVYRDMQYNGNVLEIDFTTVNSFIYHKERKSIFKPSNISSSNYLLNTKKVVFIFIDLEDNYYSATNTSNDKKLNNTLTKIKYETSFFEKSFKDLKNAIPTLGTMGDSKINDKTFSLKITIVDMSTSRIKPPCNIILSNKSFSEDLSFKIHENNIGSFQIGIVNNKFSANNFQIKNDSLFVTGDTTEKADWKSNLYAIIEIHPQGRDIDNFRPLWKVLFANNPNENKRGFGLWLYYMTIDRIGVYGGFKLAKDPLADLHAGLNYSITKEFAINVGYTWSNQIIPQTTAIGDVSSLDDAKEFATRKYSKPVFSWGLSLSPSSIVELFGSK